MTTACNWVNRVRREEKPILNDGAWLGGRVISTPSGNRLPITGHEECYHEYHAEYANATYIWDSDGNGRRVAK